jgi:hypothetical protein
MQHQGGRKPGFQTQPCTDQPWEIVSQSLDLPDLGFLICTMRILSMPVSQCCSEDPCGQCTWNLLEGLRPKQLTGFPLCVPVSLKNMTGVQVHHVHSSHCPLQHPTAPRRCSLFHSKCPLHLHIPAWPGQASAVQPGFQCQRHHSLRIQYCTCHSLLPLALAPLGWFFFPAPRTCLAKAAPPGRAWKEMDSNG